MMPSRIVCSFASTVTPRTAWSMRSWQSVVPPQCTRDRSGRNNRTMKRRFLEFLCCPMCQGGLTLTDLRTETEIEEGMLACDGCGRDFPVINGIPRLLPDALAGRIVRYHRPFFERYRAETARFQARIAAVGGNAWWAAEVGTLDSYSYQWRKF